MIARVVRWCVPAACRGQYGGSWNDSRCLQGTTSGSGSKQPFALWFTCVRGVMWLLSPPVKSTSQAKRKSVFGSQVVRGARFFWKMTICVHEKEICRKCNKDKGCVCVFILHCKSKELKLICVLFAVSCLLCIDAVQNHNYKMINFGVLSTWRKGSCKATVDTGSIK